MNSDFIITVEEGRIIAAAEKGMDAFVDVFRSAIMDAIGGELNADSMQKLNADQITLLAYCIYRDEVMDGGHVQLIHNGYGPFIFLNPFAKAMRLWGAKPFSKLVYSGRAFYEENCDVICREYTDEEFMALFEKFPEADDLDDEFVEQEETWTEQIARYIDENIDKFATIQ